MGKEKGNYRNDLTPPKSFHKPDRWQLDNLHEGWECCQNTNLQVIGTQGQCKRNDKASPHDAKKACGRHTMEIKPTHSRIHIPVGDGWLGLEKC